MKEMKGYSISFLSSYFGYTRDGYYKSQEQGTKTELNREVLLSSVREIRRDHPRMGGKKMYYLLGDLLSSLHTGRDKFIKIPGESELLVKRKKSRTKTTNSYHRFHMYKNELSKKELKHPNQAWAGDITYIRTDEGFVYLFLLTDVYSRKIVGWELSKSLSHEAGVLALKKVLKQCRNTEGVIHHSDRGIQYCSNEYTKILLKNKLSISMTEENHCYENAIAERVNGILKDEYMLDATFKNGIMTQKACAEAIDLYNRKRPHRSLGLKTPEEVHGRVA
jgi:transposase InsO family protein